MISSNSAYFSLNNQSIWRKKLVAWTMLLLMATQPMTAAAEVVADSKAAGGNRPLVETSANGLPIVQITQPSAAGISRNQYQQFNVDSRGLILNNSGIITQTQLAGYITGNPFIGHGPSARIILNEVTSKDPSYLRGYTEVAGQKADIIIANPNGIYGDGFGFINTNRAVLTTGTPVFGGSGSLDAFRVSGGQISIQGTGMNAANVDQVDLISRSVAINAQAWAKNLNVVTGSNKVDYKTMDTKTFDSDVASPQVAIDVGQLGGMYAQKIYMVGTEKGLGVNSTGTIAAQAGDVTITSAGKLLLANTSATGNIQVAAAEDVTNQKALYAQGNVDITTSGTLHNSGILTARQSTNITAQNVQSIGTVGAGIKNDGTVGTAGNLTVNAAGTIAMNGQNLAAGDLNIAGSTLSLANSKTLANGNANLTAVIGDMDHTKGSLQVNGALNVSAQGTIRNDNGNIEAEKLSLTGHSFSNHTGAITQLGKETTIIKAVEGVDNTAGIIATNGDSLQIKSNSLQNSQGQIQHAGTGELSLEMAGDIQNDAGKMATNGQLQLSAQNLNNANGQIIGQKKVNMTTQTLSNQAGKITAQDNLTITAANGIDSNLKSSDVHNTGSIVSGGDLILTSTGKMLLSGTTSANGDIQIHARDGLSNYSSLYGQGKTDIWTQSVLENSANLITAQNMNITAQSIKSSGTIGAGIQQDGKLGKDGDLTIHAGGTITTQGQNVAAKDLTITGSALTLAGSKTIAGGNGILTATTGDIDHNSATLQIGKNLAATAKGIIYNDNGTIYTDNLSLVGKGISNRNGTMSQLGKEVTILSALENVDNRNGIIATNADLLQIKADSLTNSQGQLQHAGTGALAVQTIGNIQNDKGTLATNGKLQVDAKNLDNTKGEIIGQKQVNIITQADIINSQGTIKGSDAVNIAAQGNMNNEQGTIEAKKGMGINVQSLNNQRGRLANLDASGMQVKISQGIQNQSGNISSNGKIDITVQDLSNQGGQITAQSDLTIAAANGIDSNLAAADVKNDGTIASGGNLTLTSTGKVLLSGSTSANGSIQVNAQDGLTNYSELYAAGNTTLTTSGTLQNSGAILSGQNTSMTAETVTSTGILGAGIQTNGTVGSSGDLTITATDKVTTHGRNLAAGNLKVKAGAIDLSGSTTYAGSSAELTAAAGDLDNTGASLQTAGTLTAISSGTIHNDQDANQVKGEIKAGQLTLTAEAISNQGGNLTQIGSGITNLTANNGIDNTGGEVFTNGEAIQIKANSLINSQGKIEHAGSRTLSIETITDVINDNGKLATNGQLNLSTNNLDNTQGKITSIGDALISAQGTINNEEGSIKVSKKLEVTAQSLNNRKGSLASLDASGMKVSTTQGIQNQSGNISSNGKVDITAQDLRNQSGQITAQSDLTIAAANGIDSNLAAADVKNDGTIASGGNLTLTSTGKVLLSGSTSANGSIQVNAQDGLTNYSELYAAGNTTLTTSGTLQNSGAILSGQNTSMTAETVASTGIMGAGIQTNGTVGSSGDLTITATDKVTTHGRNLAAGNLKVKAGAIDLSGSTTYAGSSAELTVAAGDLDNTGASLQTAGTLTAVSSGTIRNDQDATSQVRGEIKAGQLTLTADAISNQGGSLVQIGSGLTTLTANNGIDNTGGAVFTNGEAIQIKANSLTNSQGKLEHAGTGNLVVETITNVTNDDGKLATNGQLHLTAQKVDNTRGILSAKHMDLTSRDAINNHQGLIASSGDTLLSAQGAVNNEQGSIEASKGLILTAQSLNNQKGRIVSLGTSNMKVTTSQEIQNQSGLIGGNSKVDLTAKHLSNQSGQITAQGDLTIAAANGIDSNLAAGDVKNDGTIASGGDLTLTSAGKVLLSGSTSANGSIQVNAQDGLTNYSELYAAGNTTLTTSGTLQNSGAILSGQNTSMTAETVASTGIMGAGIQTNGTVGSSGDLTITATDKVTTHGRNLAAGNLKVKAGAIDLSGSTTYAGSSAELTAAAGDLDNTGASLQTAGTLTAVSSGTIRNDQDATSQVRGEIKAGQLTLTADAISNQGGSLVQIGSGLTTLTANNGIDNTGGAVFTNGEAIQIKANSLTNSQGKLEHAGTGNLVVETITNVTNDDGKLATNGQLHLTAQKVDNTRGILSAKHMDLTSRDAINNHQGLIASSGDTLLSAQGAVNNVQGSIEASKGLILTAQSLNNQKGRIVSLGTSNMKVTTSLEIQNQSGLIGGNSKVDITAKHLSNQSGQITAQSDLTIAAANGIDSNLTAGDVKNDGTIASGGDLTLTSTGKVLLSGSTSANGSIQVNAQDGLTNYSELYAAGNTTLTTSGTLQNSGAILSGQNTSMTAETVTSTGILGAGIQTNGTVGSSGDLTITTTDNVTTHGRNLAAGNLKVKAGAIDLSGSTTYAGSSAELTAAAGDLDNTGASLQTAGTLTAISSGTIRNDQNATSQVRGEIKAGQLNLTAEAISNQGGSLTQIGSGLTTLTANNSIDNTGGEVFTNGESIQIKANSLINSQGKVEHAGTGTLWVDTDDDFKNDNGKVASNSKINLKTKSINNANGIIAAQKRLDITSASTFNNSKGFISSIDDTIQITAQGLVNNQEGNIEANKGLNLTAQSLNNVNGRIVNVDNSDMKVAATEVIVNESGLMGGNGNVRLEAESFNNQTGQVLAEGNLAISMAKGVNNTDGKIIAKKNIELSQSTADLNNNRGTIGAGSDLVVQAKAVNNNGGKLGADKDSNITAQSIQGIGQIIAGQDLNISLSGDYINETGNELKANRNLSMTTTGMITNQGTIGAVENVNVSGSSILNDTKSILTSGNTLTANAAGSIINKGTIEGDAVNISGDNIQNTGAIFGHNLIVTADQISNEGSSAVIATTGNASLYARTAVENKDDASIYSMGDIVIAGSKDKNGTGEYANRTGTVLNQSANIEAEKDISIYADEITNKKREFVTEQTVVSTNTTHEIASIPTNPRGVEVLSGGYYWIPWDEDRYHNEDSLLPAYYLDRYSGIRVTYVSKDQIDTDTVTETLVTKDSPVGKILSGGNMTLRAGTVNNEVSWILANGTLNTVANAVNNMAVGSTRVTSHDGKTVYRKHFYREYSCQAGGENGSDVITTEVDYYKTETIPTHTTITEQLPGYTSLYGGGQGVTIQAQTITNQTIQPSGAPVGDMATTVAPTGNRENPVGNTASGITEGGNIGNSVSNNSNTVTPGSNSGASVSSTTSGIATGKNIGTSVGSNTNTVTPGNSSGISVSNTASGVTSGGNIGGSVGNNSSTVMPGDNSDIPVSSTAGAISSGGKIDAPTETKNPSVTPGGNSGIPVGTVVQEQNSSLNVDGTGKSLPSDPQIMNISKGSPSSNEFVVPTSGLFTIHTEPEQKYLVETNTHFTSYKNFASSDYMLQKITSDPEKTQKRLGDGFYEQKLVREQITNLTGRSSLDSSVSSEEEFKTLMNNGVTYAQEFNLHVGVALTSEQMKQLTSDIIWLEEREVDGQKVLVPVVYLSQVHNSDLKPTGALITGDTINITATGNLTNSGTIHADTQSAITASNIINRGGVIDGGSMTKLTATEDIINQSGMITGGQLELSAKRDIINETLVSAVNVGPIQTTLVNQIGTIAAKDGLTVQAGRDILVSGAQVAAGKEIDLNAGRNIEVTSVEHQQQLKTVLGDVKVSSETITNITSSIKAGDNLTINAQEDVTLQGAQINAGKAAVISAGDALKITSVENKESGSAKIKDTWYSKNEGISYDKTTNIASTIQAGSDVTLKGNDIDLHGAKVSAAQNISIDAKENLTVTSTQDISKIQEHGFSILNRTSALDAIGISSTDMASIPSTGNNGAFNYGTTDYSQNVNINKTTNLVAGGNVDLSAQNDIALKGVKVDAGNDASLTAGGNISVTAVKDEVSTNYFKGTSSNYNKTRTDDEVLVGSQLNAKNDITIKAGPSTADSDAIVKNDSSKGNILIEGSSVYSENGKVGITGDNEVVIKEDTERHEILTESRKVKKSTFSKKVTEKRDHTVVNQVKRSSISGDEVSISSGSDLTIQASKVVGTEDVSLSAKEDVNILSAAEKGTSEHYSYTKKTGLFSGGGLGVTIGSQSTKTTTNEQTLGEVGSSIGSVKGDVSVTAGEKVTSEGTEFISGNDLNITGKEVSIDNTINTYDSQTKFEFKQTGLSVSLGGGIIDVATSAYKNIDRSGEVEDDRLKTLYQYKAYNDLKKLKKAYDKAANLVDQKAAKDVDDVLKNDLSINVSFGTTKTTSTSTVHTETVNTSNIDAGGDVNITATEGDINLKGTKIDAKDITLDAKENINIESAENKLQTTSNTKTSSASIGASFGLTTGAFGGLSGNFTSSKGHENENSTANAESIINAKGTLTMNSGNDTNIIGSQVTGDTVVADIDGNLNIVSKQDTDDYTAKNQSSGFGISTGPKGGTTGSISQGKTDSTYSSVIEQAGIYAGDGGFDINVGKNADLKGAVIASDATPDKNKLSTDTLTYSDIQNKAEYDSSSSGVNVNTSKDAKINEKGITPNIGVKASGDADSTTKSAISPGTIEVRSNPNQDLSTLSRDTTNALNTLGKIFDKKTVKEQQELAGLFGELAFEEVHKLSKKNGWDEGSPQKIALHALVGGIMSELAGSGFTAGAKGAGFNEAIQKELSKIKDPALHQWASYIIGSAAGGAVGGATAVSGTKNNLLAYYLTSTKDALRDALRAKNGEEPTDQEIAELNAKISDALNAVFQDGRPTIEGEASVIRNVLQQNGIPSASIDDFVNVYTSQAPKAVEQYNKEQLKQGDIRTSALIETVSDNIKGTIDLIYLMTPTGQKELVQALLQDPTLPATIGREAYNSLKNWATNMQGNNGDEDQAKAQGQLLGQVLTAYATAKGTNAFKKIGVSAKEIQFPEIVVTADRIPKKWTVDPATQAADIEAGVLKNGSYIKNPTAQNINDLIKDGYNYVGSKKMNGQYMYVVDSEGSIIIGNRAGQRMPHPTLIGGENPQVQAAGIVEIRGGKIYMVDNASGHFKPGAGSLEAAEDAFSKLPSNIFSKNFQGYVPYTK